MPDGDFRRPPQLWEQRLAQLVSMTSVGVVSGGGTDPNTPDLPPGDGGPGIEPEPVTPAPVDFIAPSTPTLAGTVQGLRVSWDGLNASGNAYPSDVYVEVHYSTSGATFTPSSSTLAGTLLGSAGFFTIMGLSAGTTYFVRLVGVDAKGNRTSPSTAASSQTGLTTSSDYGTATITSGAVSFNARQIGGITTTVGTTAPTSPVTGDIWLDSSGGAIVHKRWNGSAWVTQAWGSDSLSANCITATQVAAGAITAGAIAANAVTAAKIDAGAITADKIAANAITAAKIDATAIDGKTITGASIRTASSGSRIELKDDTTYNDAILFYDSVGSLVGYLSPTNFGYIFLSGTLSASGSLTATSAVSGATLSSSGAATFGSKSSNASLRVDASGDVFSYGIDGTTTGSAANVRVEQTGARQLVRSTSTERVKTDIVGIDGDLEGVNPDKIGAGAASVDPWDVLALTPAEFQSLSPVDQNQRMLGFIAENVAAVFPFAAEWDEQGVPSSVADRPILAALLAVVKDQQAQITDLTARITALEA